MQQALSRLVVGLTLFVGADALHARAGDDPTLRWDARAVEHLYNRAAFGATRAEIAEGVRKGQQACVGELLAGDATWERVEPTLFRWEDFGLDHHQMPLKDAAFNQLASREQVMRCKNARLTERIEFFELQRRWLASILDGRDRLRDRMTLFWHGFFTTSIEVNKRKFELIHQFQWLRENALSSYADLLHGLVRDPAMLQYLDNSTNYKDHPNENFARELLELYSLGQGNYGEHDVREAARALTGNAGGSDGRFEFLAEQHDDGVKDVLGVRGPLGADELVDAILAQPACARWVTRKLLRWFEGVEPSPERLESYAATLRDAHYAIQPFLRRLFMDPDFYRGEIVGARVSSPIEYLIGVCRRLEMNPSPAFLHGACFAMGQSLYAPPSVKGWPEGLEWIKSDAMMRRGNVVGVLLGLYDDAPKVDEVEALAEPRDSGDDAPFDPSAMNPVLAPEDVTLELANLRLVLGTEPWQPHARLLGELRAAGARSDAEIVAFVLDDWLGLEPSREIRALVLDYFADERGVLGIREGELLAHEREFDDVVRRVAHLVFSLPEAQLR